MSLQFYFSPYILGNLTAPARGFDVVQDSAEPRLRLYITARGIKTFFVRARMHGRDIRTIIGRYPEMDIDDARLAVGDVVARQNNQSGNHGTKSQGQKNITFARAASRFVAARIHRSPESMAKLRREMARAFAQINDMRLRDITRAIAAGVIDTVRENSGATTANRMREIMSSVFRFADADNPALDISRIKTTPRVRTLNITGLRHIIAAIRKESDPIIRAAFLMLVYGFANRSRVFSMQWRDLDFNNDMWGGRPLSDAAVLILRELPQNRRYVFPGRNGHLTDPRAAWRRIIMRAKTTGATMSDIEKFMARRLAWSVDTETTRDNMNKAIEQLTADN